MLNKETIKEIALANGFKLKEQANGEMDLNPYVYEFANAIAKHCWSAFKSEVMPHKIHPTKASLNNGWISVDDELPTQSDQYWVAYRPISNYNPNEKTTEICYCIAHFDSYDKIWSVKDQLFYTQRRCKVLFWQPMPQPPKE